MWTDKKVMRTCPLCPCPWVVKNIKNKLHFYLKQLYLIRGINYDYC